MNTAPRPFVFVLMPFSKDFDDTYELAIQTACEAAGAYAERVDKQIFTGSILARVYNQISKADLLVADMSDRNPNVFYEVGYAHALGKTAILVTRKAEDIPFDLKDYPHIVYNDRLSDLKKQLETTIRFHLENPSPALNQESSVRVRANGIPLTGPACELVVAVHAQQAGLEIKMDIENRIEKTISVAEIQIGIISPAEFTWATVEDGTNPIVVDLDKASNLFLLPKPVTILPGAWSTSLVTVCLASSYVAANASFRFAVRIYSKSGMYDHWFDLRTVDAK